MYLGTDSEKVEDTKGESEGVNLRRIDNTMTKQIKGQEDKHYTRNRNRLINTNPSKESR
jgi:hypothetical protein